jgi:hypothetical protein
MDEKKEITFSKFSKEFADKAFSQKKINVNESIVQQIVEKIFKHIHYFNSLKADEAIIDNHPLSDWVILNEFTGFVMPNSVRYESGNRIYKDLLSRPTSDFKPDFQDYIMALSKFRGLFKKDALSDVTNLGNLRVDKSFEEVRPHITVSVSKDDMSLAFEDDKTNVVRYVDNPFIPIPVEGLYNFVDASIYFTASEKQVVADFISNITLI